MTARSVSLHVPCSSGKAVAKHSISTTFAILVSITNFKHLQIVRFVAGKSDRVSGVPPGRCLLTRPPRLRGETLCYTSRLALSEQAATGI